MEGRVGGRKKSRHREGQRTDGQKDDEQTGGQTYGRKGKLSYKWIDRLTDGYTDRRLNREQKGSRTNGLIVRKTNGQTDVHTGEQTDKLTYGKVLNQTKVQETEQAHSYTFGQTIIKIYAPTEAKLDGRTDDRETNRKSDERASEEIDRDRRQA